jgi:hypothetical protein
MLPRRPTQEKGNRFIEIYDGYFVVYEVESVEQGKAILKPLVSLDFDEMIPNEFQGLPLFDSRSPL